MNKNIENFSMLFYFFYFKFVAHNCDDKTAFPLPVHLQNSFRPPVIFRSLKSYAFSILKPFLSKCQVVFEDKESQSCQFRKNYAVT